MYRDNTSIFNPLTTAALNGCLCIECTVSVCVCVCAFVGISGDTYAMRIFLETRTHIRARENGLLSYTSAGKLKAVYIQLYINTNTWTLPWSAYILTHTHTAGCMYAVERLCLIRIFTPTLVTLNAFSEPGGWRALVWGDCIYLLFMYALCRLFKSLPKFCRERVVFSVGAPREAI